jgi:glucose/arabinose dehydrogenase
VFTRIDKGIQAQSAVLGIAFLQDRKVPEPFRDGLAPALHGAIEKSLLSVTVDRRSRPYSVRWRYYFRRLGGWRIQRSDIVYSFWTILKWSDPI